MEFRACKFVKEDSCLLGKLGKVFDLAEQQGLPGRDAQMAKVKEGPEAVAKRLEIDARGRVTVLSRGPGSGKSTALVFIADNWRKSLGGRGERMASSLARLSASGPTTPK